MLRIEESKLESICKSALCWQFIPKGPTVLLLIPPTFSLDISFSRPLLCLVFHIVFSCFCFASSLIFFNYSLSSFLNPSSLSTFPLASFYQSNPHCHHSTYSGRPFSLQMPSFCRINALVQNQFPLLSIMSPPHHYPPCIQVFSSSKLSVFCCEW